jgi:membrane protein DedA with SNARE-associated domain
VSDVLSSIGELASPWAYVVVALLATLETAAFVGLAVPGELGLLVGGYIVSEGRADLAGMMALATAGAILGDSIGYQVGRSFGPRMRNSSMGRRVGDDRWQRAENFLRTRGGRAVFFGRFVGILRALVPALAGASGMPYRRFLLWDVMGAVIWGPGLVGLGYMAGGSYDKVAEWTGRAGLVLLVMCILVAAVLAGGRWLARHPEEAAAWRDRQLARPVIRQVAPVCRRPVGFLIRRLRPGGALGLSLTIQLAVLGLAAWLFTSVLQDVVAGDELSRIDEPVTRYLTGHRVAWLTTLLRGVSRVGDLVTLAALVIAAGAWAWRRSKTWVPMATMAAAFLGAAALNAVVRPLVGRPRPQIGPMIDSASGFAFPSAHATQTIAVYGALAVLGSRHLRSWTRAVAVWTAATLVVLLVGFSRLYLGINWITDVVGGYALGALWLVAVLATTGALRHHQRARAPAASATERASASDRA